VSGSGARYSAFDRFQQRDRCSASRSRRSRSTPTTKGYLAASITYYGFFAIFPLLLVLTTVLGFILQGDPHLRRTIVDSALGQFPVIGPSSAAGRWAAVRLRSGSVWPPRCGRE
jgi:Virulence factor BrkB